MGAGSGIDWVVLTMGDRSDALGEAVASLHGSGGEVVVVGNTDTDLGSTVPSAARAAWAGSNLGVPGGRHFGVSETTAEIIGFLDDDAVLSPDVMHRIAEVFDARPAVGAVALRLVDEAGETARRHVPRRGGDGADETGDVALFLGGACAIRRTAYESVGGYFTDLVYGHEELELCWRLIDGGWAITYLADVTVFHPRTEISRHAHGWGLTGRNRVWIARRTLPWPVALVHTLAWLVVGLQRAPAGCRRSYLAGWWDGWRNRWTSDVERSPIRWSTVMQLARLGRLPLI